MQKEQGLEGCQDRIHSGKGPGLPSHPAVASMNWGDRIILGAPGHFGGQKGTRWELSQESCPVVALPVRLQKTPSATSGSEPLRTMPDRPSGPCAGVGGLGERQKLLGPVLPKLGHWGGLSSPAFLSGPLQRPPASASSRPTTPSRAITALIRAL